MKLTKFACLVCALAGFDVAYALLPTPNPLVPQNTPTNNIQQFGLAQSQPVYSSTQPVFYPHPHSVTQHATTPQSPPQAYHHNPTLSQTQAFTPAQSEQFSSTLYAYVLEGDTLTPVTPYIAIKAGDLIEYHAHITNNSQERIRSLNVSLDVPAGVELIGNFNPKNALASVDGARFYPTPLRTQVGGQTENIALNKYKALRWRVQDLDIGKVAVVKFQVRLK